MTTQQTNNADESVITNYQVTKNNISANVDALTFDPWQSLNAAISVVEGQIDSNDTSIDATTNAGNNDEIIDNPVVVDDAGNEIQSDEPLTDAVISDTSSSLDDQINGTDNNTANTDNSSEVIDNPNLIDDTGDEIQIDEPLSDMVDVADNPVPGSLDISNEPLGLDNGNLNGLVTNNTGLLTDSIASSLTWVVFTVADADIVDFGGLSPNSIEVTSGDNVDLNSDFIASRDSVATDETQLTLLSDDTMITADDDVFSIPNSNISVLGTLACNKDFYFTYSVIENTDNNPSIQLIGNTENTNTEGWIA